MNENLINVFLIIGLVFICLEFKLWKNNLIYLGLILLIIYITLNFSIWDINLFNLDLWKVLFLFLVSLSFFIVIIMIQEKTFDVYSLLILVYIGSLILIVSDNLLIVYLGLELQTFSIFILIAKNRISIKSAEASLKYFMLGAISSGFYLLGLVILLLYGFNLSIKEMLFFHNDYIIFICITLICLSICFKLSLFPFHFWIPDIYEGSSWDILMLISTVPKISVICILIQILINSNILLSFSLVSIGIGTLGALNQTKLKRFLAYSGISHMGFIILSYSIFCKTNIVVGSFYLCIYIILMLSLLILIINDNIKNNFIIELAGLKFTNRVLAVTLILSILSIAGIPPLSGFISKWYLIWVIIENDYNISSIIIILFSIISLGYYLRIVKTIYFQRKASYFLWDNILSTNSSKEELSYLSLGAIFFITLFFMLNFNFMLNLLSYTFYFLY